MSLFREERKRAKLINLTGIGGGRAPKPRDQRGGAGPAWVKGYDGVIDRF